MSNQIVTKGWSGPLLVTHGWGSGLAISTGKSIITMATGNLLIDVEASGPDFFLQFEDGTNTIFQQLPFTAAQKAGTAFAIISIIRDGTNLLIYQDKVLVATIAITVKTYGGVTKVMELNPEAFFDMRVVQNKVSKEAIEYYTRDVDENKGDSNLPSAG